MLVVFSSACRSNLIVFPTSIAEEVASRPSSRPAFDDARPDLPQATCYPSVPSGSDPQICSRLPLAH